jgi:dipeptidyl aminopeptidase/acylaminoacyl peptidase
VDGLTPTPFNPASGSCNPTAGSLRPDAVVGIAGAVNNVTEETFYVTSMVGADQKTKPDAWAAIDPFALAKRYPADADAVPFLLIQGGADGVIPPAISRSFRDALRAAGYSVDLVEPPLPGHEEIVQRELQTVDAIMKFVTGT